MPPTFGRHPLRQTGWSHRPNVATTIETWRRHQFPIVLAASHCPTARDFVPWRFLVAGRFSVPSRTHPGDQKPAQEQTSLTVKAAQGMPAVAPRCRPVGSVVVAVADVDPLPAVCSWPPLVAINVAVVVEAEAGERPVETVPCEVVSTVPAAADIASTATAISKTGAP